MILFTRSALVVACFQLITQLVHNTPVIGILTLHTNPKLNYPEGTTYMYTSYAKWIEQSEMRWIPISVFEPTNMILEKLKKVNGMLLTGGNEVMGSKNLPSLYASVVKMIINYSIEQSNAETIFPVFGICMGFESLMVALSNYEMQLEKVSNENQSLSLKFTPSSSETFLNLYFSPKQLEAADQEKIFFFHHRDGFSMNQVNKSNYVAQNLKVLATTITSQNQEILAIFQHQYYPFIGVQFHPEKTQFEYSDNENITRSEFAANINSGFSKLFRRLIGEYKSKLTTKEVLEYRVNVNLKVEYGQADECYVFNKVSQAFPRDNSELAGDETTAE